MTTSRTNLSNDVNRALDEGWQTNVNPLANKLTMSKLCWLRMFILSVFIFPIRIILTIVIVLFAYVVSIIGLLNMRTGDEVEKKPIGPGWRRRSNQINAFMGKIITRVLGLVITIKGERASVEDAPILVAGPLSTGFDCLVVWWSDNPSLILDKDLRNMPIVGRGIN